MAKNRKGDMDYCGYPRCREQSDIIWLETGVCQEHFKKICNMTMVKAYMVMEVSEKKIKENSTPCGC